MPKQTYLIVLRDLLEECVIFESSQNALEWKTQLPVGPHERRVTVQIVTLNKRDNGVKEPHGVWISYSYHGIGPYGWILFDLHLNFRKCTDTELQMGTDDHLSDVVHFFCFDVRQQFLLVKEHGRQFSENLSMNFRRQGR